MVDYSSLDRLPQLLQYLFYPRPDLTPAPENSFDLYVPAEDGIQLMCRFYYQVKDGPWLLFFHGNGEVASDYDLLAPLFHSIGVNVVVNDYRGYGGSGGTPTMAHLVKDAHWVYASVREKLAIDGMNPELVVMGRSLGSISALELAYGHPETVRGVIIESGFTAVSELIKHLGIPAEGADLDGIEQQLGRRIEAISVPALIIHGEWDEIVPAWQGRRLHLRLGSPRKKLVVIPGADHNDILFTGMEQYLAAIQEFLAGLH